MTFRTDAKRSSPQTVQELLGGPDHNREKAVNYVLANEETFWQDFEVRVQRYSQGFAEQIDAALKAEAGLSLAKLPRPLETAVPSRIRSTRN